MINLKAAMVGFALVLFISFFLLKKFRDHQKKAEIIKERKIHKKRKNKKKRNKNQ